MAKYKQLVYPDMSTRDGPGWCLRFTQTAFRAPVAYPTARIAWEAQKGRHFDTPPLGIKVPIWLDHHGSYGSPPRWDNFGHVAVWLGDGRVLSSPMNAWQGGQKIFGSIREMIAALGNGKYLGWSEYMNGKRVAEKVSEPTGKPETPRGSKGLVDLIVIRSKASGHVFTVGVRYIKHLKTTLEVTRAAAIVNPTQSKVYDYALADFNAVLSSFDVPQSVANEAPKRNVSWLNGKWGA